MAGIHPCGAVPISTWSTHVWYCHYHQAYWASISIYHEAGDGDVRVSASDSIEFGPFDSSTDAAEWITARVSAIGDLQSLR